jgi:hypothetical protein
MYKTQGFKVTVQYLFMYESVSYCYIIKVHKNDLLYLGCLNFSALFFFPFLFPISLLFNAFFQ